MRRLKVLGGAAGVALLAACAAGGTPGFGDATADGNADAKKTNLDAPTSHKDTGVDTGVDSSGGSDAHSSSRDAGHDADSGPVIHDGGHDAAHDGGTDGGHDAGHDSGVDSGIDAGFDSGFLVFYGAPGTPCTTEGDLQAQTCGLCGTQTSQCILRPDGGIPFDAGKVDATLADAAPAKDSGPALVWGEFGACSSELDGGCVPGTSKTIGCGTCGTETLLCEPDCQYGTSECSGQKADACVPGSVDFTVVSSCESDGGLVVDGGKDDAGHDDAGHSDAGPRDAATDVVTIPPVAGRSQTCSATCAWEPSTSCELPPSTLTIAPDITGKVTTVVNLSPAQETPRLDLTTPCPASGVSSTVSTPYALVTVKNSSTSKSAVVSAWTWQVPGAISVSTYFTAYSATPTTQSQFLNCLVAVTNTCMDMSDPTACVSGSTYGGLMLGDGNALTIPAGGSIVLFVQDQKNIAKDIGPVEVTVRTEAFE